MIPNRYLSIIPLTLSTYLFHKYQWYLQKTPILFALIYDLTIIISFLITHYFIIPKLIKIHIRAGLFGHDIYKKGLPSFKEKIAETLGLGISISYFGSLIIFYLYFKVYGEEEYANVITVVFGYIVCGTFLGFVDDILELRWRHKLIYPFFFSLFIILNYQGNTKIHFPIFLENLLGFQNIELGIIFLLYLVLLCIFCVNSINIYAGISGLESGQAFIIALTLIIENIFCILENDDAKTNKFSIMILGPFCAVSLSLLIFNKVKKKTFVGDTFCYFAGCVIAAAGIMGKFPVKLLLFFIPQLINFILSLPQLFGIIFCPRHRLPIMDHQSKKLKTTFPKNWNLINFALYLIGDLTEQQLGDFLLHFQIFCNLAVIIFCRIFKFSI